MRIGIPFFISNKVVEFETDRLIAWRHFGRHRWRYELDPVGDGATRVTETFDYSMAPGRLLLHVSPFPARNATGIEATLDNCKKTSPRLATCLRPDGRRLERRRWRRRLTSAGRWRWRVAVVDQVEDPRFRRG